MEERPVDEVDLALLQVLLDRTIAPPDAAASQQLFCDDFCKTPLCLKLEARAGRCVSFDPRAAGRAQGGAASPNRAPVPLVAHPPAAKSPSQPAASALSTRTPHN